MLLHQGSTAGLGLLVKQQVGLVHLETGLDLWRHQPPSDGGCEASSLQQLAWDLQTMQDPDFNGPGLVLGRQSSKD